MDLNNLELSPFMLAGLYNRSLVETGESDLQTVPARVNETEPSVKLTAAKEVESTWKSLGGNRKNILLIVSYNDDLHLPDSALQFLTGILSACKLDLADVSIVNLNNHPGTGYLELVTYFKSRIVLLFDVEPASFGLPMNFPTFQIQPFANNSFLYSPSLEDLGNDKLLKSKLWVCLKRLFNL